MKGDNMNKDDFVEIEDINGAFSAQTMRISKVWLKENDFGDKIEPIKCLMIQLLSN